jgi:hypothetical protein
MDSNATPDQDRRESFLTIFLTALGLFFFLMVLVLISDGIFLYVVLVVGGIVLYGMIHYLLWGRLMSQATAGESEEEILRMRAVAEQWPGHDSHGIRKG